MTTTTNDSTTHCTECGQAKPVIDRFGHQVRVDFFNPPDGNDSLVMVSTFDRGGGDKRPHVLLLTTEMADNLAVELASMAEAERQFRLEAQSMTRTRYAGVERPKPKRKPIRVYELYPLGFGSFSVQTADYYGSALMVAATSVRQAYLLASKNIWIDPERKYPVGIVSKYRRDTGFTLWCGCRGHSVSGGDVSHGDGIRALRAAIADHHCDAYAKVMDVPPPESLRPRPPRPHDDEEPTTSH